MRRLFNLIPINAIIPKPRSFTTILYKNLQTHAITYSLPNSSKTVSLQEANMIFNHLLQNHSVSHRWYRNNVNPDGQCNFYTVCGILVYYGIAQYNQIAKCYELI